MASLLTNASAMTALQTLSLTNKNLATTQNRIATGLRVSEASDNAAYWSISTGMRAQNGALSAVKDSMGFGAAVVDTAYTALNEAISKTEEIFQKYVSLQQGGVDEDAVNAEIDQLKAQVEAIAKNADFEGQNLLKTGGDDLSVVTGYIKSSGPIVAGAAISLDPDNGDATASAVNETITSIVTGFEDLELAAGQHFTFSVGSKSYSISGGSSGMNNNILIGTIQSKLEADGIAAEWDGSDTLTLTKEETAVGESIGFGGGEIGAATGGVEKMLVRAFDLEDTISDATDAVTAESALIEMRAAAATMGAAKMRIDSQVDFTGKLMDAIDRGIGVLVDADMNAESARLSALQTQQQLGIQALSIANQSSQNILSLFR